MADKSRPIRIEIPAELELTEEEIASIRSVFRSEVLGKLAARGVNEPLIGNPINTTRLAVEVEVIGAASRRRSTKKPRKPTTK